MSRSSGAGWFEQSIKTRQGWAGLLTAFVPVALVLGRAPADIVVSIIALLFLADSIITREWRWIKTPWISVLLALWGYSVLRACFIHDSGKYIFPAFVWLRYICFAASTAFWTLKELRYRNALLYSVIVSTGFLSLDTILQYVTGSDILGHSPVMDYNRRLTASFNHPIVGMSIANIFAPAVFWLLDKERPVKSILLGGLAFMAVLLSGERMALIFAACVMLLWVVLFVREHKKLLPLVITGVCALVVLVSMRGDLLQRQVISSAKVISNLETSPYGYAWTSGIHVGEAYPLFGAGMQQFRYACKEERFGPLFDQAGIPRCYIHPHNAYIEWFAENGIIGLSGFLAFIGLYFLTLGRQLKLHSHSMILWGLAVTVAVRLLPFFTSTSFFNNWSAIPFWLCVGWAVHEATNPDPQPGA